MGIQLKEGSETCYETIRKSWSEIDRVASNPHGLSILSQKFKTCSHLNNSKELKNYLDNMYAVAAQYNHPPLYPVTVVYGGIDGANEGTDILDQIFAGLVAYTPDQPCYPVQESDILSEIDIGWNWQTCSEMVLPIGHGTDDTISTSAFQSNAIHHGLHKFVRVPPHPHWVTTYYHYRGHGIGELIRHSSCYSYHQRSHCLDILMAKETDPQLLIKLRKVEVKIIDGWIRKY